MLDFEFHNFCACGCGQAAKPGKRFYSSGCAGRGKKMNLSPAERKARSTRRSILNATPEHRAQVKELGKSAKARKRLSERNRQNWKDPAYRQGQTERIRALQPKLKRKKKIGMKRRWAQDAAFRKRFFKGWTAALADRNKPSKLHLRIKAAMDAAGLTNFKTHQVVGHFCLDEADPNQKIAVEINGCYWHGCPKCYPDATKLKKRQSQGRANDERRMTYLRRKGWRVLVLWEHTLADAETAVEQIAAFMEGAHDGTESRSGRD